MPYTKEHKQESREKILKSSVDLFCRKGYDNVSIDDLMKDADLTRGAFYAHFDSKSDVYMQSIISAAQNSGIFLNIPEHLEKEALLSHFIDGYLSPEHVKQEFSPCPMAFLATDVANREPKVKKTYTKVFEGFVNLISKNLPEEFDSERRKQVSYELSALAIGSVAIGRALDNEEIRDQMLLNNKKVAKALINCE